MPLFWGVGQHPGMVGQHKTEWWVNIKQNLHEILDAAIVFAPVGSLVPKALQDVDKGGTIVCGGIHMSDIPSFPYRLLWEERSICSVANLTRNDGETFFQMANETAIHTSVTTYPLHKANEAIHDLRHGNIHGAAVLVMN